ncbi:MAG TPA: sigma-54 dependent transcriptional regulator [Gemmata sp.]|nr:sigma-54 dependent transcriptional regulator [Gemmata sp.]
MTLSKDSLNLLVIDDEPSLRRTLRTALESMGHVVSEAANVSQALEIVLHHRFDLAFLDLRLGTENGLDLLPRLLFATDHRLHVVIVTAFASIDSAIDSLRKGAFDYLPKPFTPDQIRIVLNRSTLVRGLTKQVADLTERAGPTDTSTELTTQEPAMQQVLDVALRVAPTDATVLLRGESGTGKGVLARAIHNRSQRGNRSFATVHCPAIPNELFESELFGHVRGSFTGAVQDRAGRVDAADGGTLFLDEIGDLPLSLQPKLLRLAQDKEFERVGDPTPRKADVRIIAATNRDLNEEVKAGRFREDLFYRLNVIELTLPPLRQRPKDVLTLARSLLQFISRQAGKPLQQFTAEAEAAIQAYSWPGNVRELRNAVERGTILSPGQEIGLEHLPGQLTGAVTKTIEVGAPVTLEELEGEHIRRIVAASSSLDEAAKIMGIDPSTLYRKRLKAKQKTQPDKGIIPEPPPSE